MTVEKVDLLSLFEPVCKRYRIQITNVSGWSDLNSRAAIMRRFAHWEARGKKCVLLHCGDHDPGGLHISDFLRDALYCRVSLSGAVSKPYSPDPVFELNRNRSAPGRTDCELKMRVTTEADDRSGRARRLTYPLLLREKGYLARFAESA